MPDTEVTVWNRKTQTYPVRSSSMETAKMYISNEPQNGHTTTTTKYASTNSIPKMMEQESSLARIFGAIGKQRENATILRDTKGRRHSVLEDLKARRDSLFQRATRRASMFDEKENTKDRTKEKRRSSNSESGRRNSVFYVSEDLLEENQEILESEDRVQLDQEVKKGRRRSWHPLVKPPKLDRKRRKGVTTGGGDGVSGVVDGAGGVGGSGSVSSQTGSTEGLDTQTRQKRPSWWNIFIPESVVRYYLNHWLEECVLWLLLVKSFFFFFFFFSCRITR